MVSCSYTKWASGCHNFYSYHFVIPGTQLPVLANKICRIPALYSETARAYLAKSEHALYTMNLKYAPRHSLKIKRVQGYIKGL